MFFIVESFQEYSRVYFHHRSSFSIFSISRNLSDHKNDASRVCVCRFIKEGNVKGKMKIITENNRVPKH